MEVTRVVPVTLRALAILACAAAALLGFGGFGAESGAEARPAQAFVGPEPPVADGAAALVGRSVDRVAREVAEARRKRRAARRERAERRARERAAAAIENAAGEPLEVGEPCAEPLARAAAAGLRLPDGWEIHCPGPGLDWEGGSHWGVTCPYAECPEGPGRYVSISNPTYYVVAHELCHANFGNDELEADRCAAEHGASLATSPYS